VLELLETIEIDTRVIARCRELKAHGFKLALDDFFHYSEAYDAVLDLIDIVKIDTQRLDHDSLSDLVSRLRLWPARLLAEKVQTLERARLCLALGFELFQGFFFGRPTLLAPHDWVAVPNTVLAAPQSTRRTRFVIVRQRFGVALYPSSVEKFDRTVTLP
jgi:c-di-GMP-related signal transduction protein